MDSKLIKEKKGPGFEIKEHISRLDPVIIFLL